MDLLYFRILKNNKMLRYLIAFFYWSFWPPVAKMTMGKLMTITPI